MPLTGPQKKQLHHAILSGFNPSTLKQFTAFNLNEELDNIIPANANFNDAVFALIEWAESHGRTEELIRFLKKDRSNNPLIQAIATAASTGSDQLRAAVPTTAPARPIRWRKRIAVVACSLLVLIIVSTTAFLAFARKPPGELDWKRVDLALVPPADWEQFASIDRSDPTGASFLGDAFPAVTAERSKNNYDLSRENHYFCYVSREWNPDKRQPRRIGLKHDLRAVLAVYAQGSQNGHWQNEWRDHSAVGDAAVDLSAWKPVGSRRLLVVIVFPLDQRFYQEQKTAPTPGALFDVGF